MCLRIQINGRLHNFSQWKCISQAWLQASARAWSRHYKHFTFLIQNLLIFISSLACIHSNIYQGLNKILHRLNGDNAIKITNFTLLCILNFIKNKRINWKTTNSNKLKKKTSRSCKKTIQQCWNLQAGKGCTYVQQSYAL